jgi:gamma-glutamyltranspeptidase / glutathione hydrolase
MKHTLTHVFKAKTLFALHLGLLVVCKTTFGAPAINDVRGERADRGMVVSQTRQSSEVGRVILEKGGNAVDAAVATAFALAVTWPEAGNIGGGGFMMIAPPDDGPMVCVDYREIAPGAATEDMYAKDGNRHNYRAVGVPGTVAGLALAHEKYGVLPWRDVVMPSVVLARDGFVMDKWQASSINGGLRKVEGLPEELAENLRRVYGKRDKTEWSAGDHIELPWLAMTLGQIAEDGADAFYRGPIADLLVDDMRRHGGLISKQDLANYKAVVREPIHGSFRGYDVYGAPPPSSGGTTLVLALNILEALDLDPAERYSAANTHKIIEAMRRAFRDRAAHLGDPDFTTIPEHLTTKAYATGLASGIDLNQATNSEDLLGEIKFTRIGKDTTHFSVIDEQGMAVSNTYTIEQSWGSRMVVAGAGFVLNNEMGDFNWTPGGTNSRGSVGTPANIIRPGKRMLSSMCPVILKRDGEVVLITGSPGGRTIINTVLTIVLNTTLFDMSLAEAVDAPRMHHQWFPDQVRYEAYDESVDPKTWEALASMGHKVVASQSAQGSAHSIMVTTGDGRYIGVADKRRGGKADGY